MPVTNHLLDRNYQNTLEKILSQDLNAISDLALKSMFSVFGELLGLGGADSLGAHLPGTLLPAPAQKLRVLRGLRVTALGVPGAAVNIGSGLGFVGLANPGTSSLSAAWPIYVETDISALAVPALANPAFDRTDRVVFLPRSHFEDVDVRDTKDLATLNYLPTPIYKRLRLVARAGTYAQYLAGTCEIAIKPGVEAAPGTSVPPALVGDEVSLATVLVAAAAPAIVQADITDERTPGMADASIPYIHLHAKGTDGAGYGAGSISRIRATGGAAITATSRPGGAGVYAFGFDGIDSTNMLRCITVTTAPAGAAMTSACVFDSGAGGCTVYTYNAAGAAADVDFNLVIRGSHNAGGLY